jgi:hypothetical protein
LWRTVSRRRVSSLGMEDALWQWKTVFRSGENLLRITEHGLWDWKTSLSTVQSIEMDGRL